VVWSDDGRQYIDRDIVGEDRIKITTDSTGALVSIEAAMGQTRKPSKEDPVGYKSTRRVRFQFKVADGTPIFPESKKAVYDILVARERKRGTLDGIVHFAVWWWKSEGLVNQVAFIIDPGYDGTAPDAITQKAVNDFYPDDTNENYCTGDYGHVCYYLGYPGYPKPPSLTPVGGPTTWTIEPSGPVTLYVWKSVGRKGSSVFEKVDLATYTSLPFQLTVSTGPLAAPRKHNTLSTTWGEIKAK
jgi:hypothetical protein